MTKKRTEHKQKTKKKQKPIKLEKLQFKENRGPGQIRTQELCCHR